MQPPLPRHKLSSSKKLSAQNRSHKSNSSKRSSTTKHRHPKKKRRKKSTSSSSSSIEEEGSDEEDGPPVPSYSSSKEYRSSTRRLTDPDMWKISEYLSSKPWRALGRNLSLEEGALTHIDSSYKNLGPKELVYQVLLEWKSQKSKKSTLGALYSTLERTKMYDAAKLVASIKFDTLEA
jgi:hypothetical protein